MIATELERGFDTALTLAKEAAPQFLLGSTALLAVGCIAAWFAGTPIRRLRIAEGTLLAVAVWLALAVVPLPRFSWPSAKSAASQVSQKTPDDKPREEPLVPPSNMAPDPMPSISQSGAGPQDSSPAASPRRRQNNEPSQARSTSITPTVEIETPVAESVRDSETAIEVPREAAPAEPRGPRAIERESSTAPAVAIAAAPFDWQRIILIAYALGAVGVAVWLLLGRAVLQAWVFRAEPTPAWLVELFDDLNRTGRSVLMVAGRSVRLVVSRRCHRPMSFGLWRPIVMLPATLCRMDARLRLAHVLRHELAHVAQRDARGHLLFNLLFPLLYVHPLYWRLRVMAHLSRELIADDAAARETSPSDYAREMLAIVRDDSRPRIAWGAALGLWSAPSQFYRRMSQLIERQTPLATACSRRWRWLAAGTLSVAVVLTAGQWGAKASWSPFESLDDQADSLDLQATIERYLAAERLAHAARERAQRALVEIELLVERVRRLEANLGNLEQAMLAAGGEPSGEAPPAAPAADSIRESPNLIRLVDAYFDARAARDRLRVALEFAIDDDRNAAEAAYQSAAKRFAAIERVLQLAREDAAAEASAWQAAAQQFDALDDDIAAGERQAFATAARKAQHRQQILDAALHHEANEAAAE